MSLKVVANNSENEFYMNFSIENLQAFVNDLDEGSLEAYTKSEPIPENNDSGAKVAVAKNFEELVTKYDGDVLIGELIKLSYMKAFIFEFHFHFVQNSTLNGVVSNSNVSDIIEFT